ncbi:MAG: cadherin-like beta sandwich domain-containing protein [Myxococcota bacterium]
MRLQRLVLISAFVSSCGSDDPPADSTALLVTEASSEQCVSGGVVVQSGLDVNSNGALDADEIQSTQVVCGGADGVDGTNGTDGIDGTDGVDGAQGSTGATALVSQAPESPGENCPFGGIRFDVGIDTNADDVLEASEVSSTEYVCQPENPVSADATLEGIELSVGALDQAFFPSVTEYTASVLYLVSAIRIRPLASDAGAILTVNGEAVNSGEFSPALELTEGVNEITIEVTGAGGATVRSYSVAIERKSLQEFAQIAYAKASNTDSFDQFGSRVSVWGDTLAVAANREDGDATGVNGDQGNGSGAIVDTGAVYVFTRSNGIWSQQAYLKASNTDDTDNFGASVSLWGDTLAVGATFEDSEATGVNGDQGNGTIENPGAVYVFNRSNGVWSQQAYLKASNTDEFDLFGTSVSLWGATLAVGAIFESSDATGVDGDQGNSAIPFYESGAVYVFIRNEGVWSQQAYLKSSNTDQADSFGTSVSLWGDTLAVGADREDSDATGVNGDQGNGTGATDNSGAVYVFVRNDSVWSQQAYLKASNTGDGDNFGESVSLWGETLAVGAGDAGNSGAVYVFSRSNGVWSQQAFLKASNPGGGDDFGASVSVWGNTLAVGAAREDSGATGVNGDEGNGVNSAGAVYVFTRNNGVWSQRAYLKASNTEANDNFGRNVSVWGDTLAAGANLEDGDSNGVNGDQGNGADSSGAVYVFR